MLLGRRQRLGAARLQFSADKAWQGKGAEVEAYFLAGLAGRIHLRLNHRTLH
jgi:hypothetical protein